MFPEFLKRREALGGLLLMAIGAGFLYFSLSFPLGTMRRVGPGAFPALVAGLLILVGVLVLVKASGPNIKATNLRPLLLILTALAFFAILLPKMGFAVATMVLVLLSARAHPDFSWPSGLLLAIGVTLIGGAIFIIGLGLPLPLFGPWLRL